MVKEVSADSLKTCINEMISFGTRSALSSTTGKKRVIRAAREWVMQKFAALAKNSGDQLTAFAQKGFAPVRISVYIKAISI